MSILIDKCFHSSFLYLRYKTKYTWFLLSLKVLSDDEVALLSHALVQSNYQEKLKLLLDLEEIAHDRELMER